jgi:hypothetical protein
MEKRLTKKKIVMIKQLKAAQVGEEIDENEK